MNLDPQIVADFENYFVLYKPPGWFVHPPSDGRALRKFRSRILTQYLQNQLGGRVHPVHRLDFATEGILVWAKNPESAGALSRINEGGGFTKIYHAIVRGHPTPRDGLIEIPLASDSSLGLVPCRTEYKTLQQIDLPHQVHSKYPTSRYAWLEVRLHTGRWHQIRRHMNRISHPIIGDREHGDSHHNRFFRECLKIPGLLLKAQSLRFQDPFNQEPRFFESPQTPNWSSLQALFQ